MSGTERSLPISAADPLFELDADHARIVALLDRRLAYRSILSGIRETVGVDLSWVGEVDDDGNLVLGYSVDALRTDTINGLVVPPGMGLGGKVLVGRQSVWVDNYPHNPSLSNPYSAHAEAEQVKGMIAVPLTDGERLLGVLYGAHRKEMIYGDVAVHALERAASRAAAAVTVAERARHSAEVAVHEERRRVALALHDTVGAMLFTIGARVQKLTDVVENDPDVRGQLDAIQRQASEASAALRESLEALSVSPETVALPVALRSDCRSFEERTDIPTRILILDELPALPIARVKGLADAAREALLNIEKHAQATSVLVTVFSTQGRVMVTVADDGHGLAPECDRRPGLGLAATADRLERVGGSLSIAANDDGGVTVRAWVPA